MAVVKHMIIPSFLLLAILLQSSYPPASGEKPGYLAESLDSFFPSKECRSTPAMNGKNGSLPLFRGYGPCSPLGNWSMPNMTEVLNRDRLRSLVIALELAGGNTSRASRDWASLDMEAISYRFFFLVSMGLGTPQVNLLMFFDTGSYTNWVHCRACGAACRPGIEFDPSRSVSYRPTECSEPVCAAFPKKQACSPGGASCPYLQNYGKGFSQGVLSRDTLRISTYTLDGFVFGCSLQSDAGMNPVAGIMGLSNNPYSMARQLSGTFGGGFSYCLPTSSRQKGHLTFGGYHVGRSPLAYTPLLSVPGSAFYYVSLLGINVGGQRLPIPATDFSTRGTIIDSGTTLTLLPRSAYIALRDTFHSGMANYRRLPPTDPSDESLCYDFTGVTTPSIPIIELIFDGVTIKLGTSGAFYGLDPSCLCLAFDVQTSTTTPFIFGSNNHLGLEVVYDLAHSRLGFGSGTCV